MHANLLLKCIFALVVGGLAGSRPVESQEQTPMPTSTYPNTEEGLRQPLREARATAKRGDKQKVASFVKNTEFPNYEGVYGLLPPNRAFSARTLSQGEATLESPDLSSVLERAMRIGRCNSECDERTRAARKSVHAE
jgi:hypothetical protein